MKIAYVVETFTEGLGYIDNILPKELAAQGAQVHLITCRLPPYYAKSASHFGALLQNAHLPIEAGADGLVIHTLKYRSVGSRILIKGLYQKLREIRPDAVIVRGISSAVLGQVVLAKIFCGFSILTSTGQAYSAVPENVRNSQKWSLVAIRHFWSRYLFGRLFSIFVKRCITSTNDGSDAVVEFYGVPRKKVLSIPLGVDLRLFYPCLGAECIAKRKQFREAIGVREEEILCIWTGRMSGKKGIGLLASAIESLWEEGYPFRCVFIGSGPEGRDLAGFSRSIQLPFMSWNQLPEYYRASDLAVWPRSITTSTLDASACGLPVIMSDREKATERWEGIGSSYIEGSVESLKLALLQYLDRSWRETVGARGASRMEAECGWPAVAARFLSAISGG